MLEENIKYNRLRIHSLRICAFLIDLAVVWLITFAFFLFPPIFLPIAYLDNVDFETIIFICLLITIFPILYFCILEWKFNATFGKHILGFQVKSIKGKKIKLTQAVVRSVTFFLFSFIYLITQISFLLKKDGRGIHEVLSKTETVIK